MSQDQHRDRRGAMDASSPEVVVPTVPDDLVAMLDLLAQTIVQALGFGVTAVNIARPDGSLEVISVAGDERARKTLLGTVYSAEIWDQILGVSEPWASSIRRSPQRGGEPDLLSWIPDVVPLLVDDAWHPQDALFAPLIAEDGSRLGILSVDLPQDGRRPNSATCDAFGGLCCLGRPSHRARHLTFARRIVGAGAATARQARLADGGREPLDVVREASRR